MSSKIISARRSIIKQCIREQYMQYQFPPLDFDHGETLYSANYRFVNYLCTGQYRPGEGIAILDAGCGTGYSTLKLAQQNPDARIVGLDISHNSLKMAKKRLKKAGIPIARVMFIEGCLEQIPIKNIKFDYIVCTGVLHHTADPENNLMNLTRYLKKTGLIYLLLYSTLSRYYINIVREFVDLFEPQKHNMRKRLRLVKELFNTLPQQHPVIRMHNEVLERANKQYNGRFTFSDAFYVDTYMNVYERTYSMEQVFQLLNEAKLFPARFLDENDRINGTIFQKSRVLRNEFKGRSLQNKYKISELLYPERNFAFWASKQKIVRKKLNISEIISSNIEWNSLNKVDSIKTMDDTQIIQIKSPLNIIYRFSQHSKFIFEDMQKGQDVMRIIENLSETANIPIAQAKKLIVKTVKEMEAAGMIYVYEK